MADVKYLTRLEALERLNINHATLDRMCKDGRLEKYKRGFGNEVYFLEDAVEELLKHRKAA